MIAIEKRRQHDVLGGCATAKKSVIIVKSPSGRRTLAFFALPSIGAAPFLEGDDPLFPFCAAAT